MEVEEVEAAIDELENRLERLRSLYEQYFLGIEKIEPTVARKDVDRRIWVLRREQIRNTARRFKLQTIIQRYNTFQQYWQRICREIENGTYKRHLLRAEKNFGPEQALTIAARKRFRKRGELADNAAADKALEAQNQLAADLGAALDNKDYDPLEEAKRAVDAALGRTDASRASSAPEREKQSSPPAEPRRAPSARPRQLGRLELDLDDDFLGGQRPAAAPAKSAPAQPTAPARPPSAQPAAAPAPPPAAPEQPAAAAEPAQPTPAPPVRPAAAAAARAPNHTAAPMGETAAKADEATSRPLPPPPARRGPPRPPPRAAKPGPPPPPVRSPAPARSGGGPPAPPARPRPPPPRAATGPGQAGMSDDRVRELHARLVNAQKQTNDRQDISVDRFKKKLEAVESRLRERHGNRRIDFDVVIKDGKAVVKPIVR